MDDRNEYVVRLWKADEEVIVRAYMFAVTESGAIAFADKMGKLERAFALGVWQSVEQKHG